MHPRVALRPTYVLATSPGSSATVSTDGRVTFSGSGVAILSTHDFQSDASSFIEQFLQHSNLPAWNVLTHNPGFPSVVLGTRCASQSRELAIIPLWPSDLLQFLRLSFTSLSSGASGTGNLKESALFAPHNLTFYLFDEESSKQNISIQFDSTSNQFTLCPVYRLQSSENPASRKIWAATVLSSHHVVQSSQILGEPLPTPPPSPSLKAVAHLAQSGASMDTIASVDALPSDTDVSVKTSAEDDYHESHGTRSHSASPEGNSRPRPGHQSPPLQITRRPAPARSMIYALIRTLFAAVVIVLKFVFWFRIVPLQLWRPRFRLLAGKFAGDQSLDKSKYSLSKINIWSIHPGHRTDGWCK